MANGGMTERPLAASCSDRSAREGKHVLWTFYLGPRQGSTIFPWDEQLQYLTVSFTFY